MARPKVHHEERITTAVRIPESLHSRLREAADERELSANYLIVRAIEDYLDRLIPADEFSLVR
jgi:predicted HicB family RNase H-like nuclease